jgi:hypothetical protein
MKKLIILSFSLLITMVGFTQVVRDHRTGGKKPYTPPPTQPPPVAGKPMAGQPATAINTGKWYYIKHFGTEKYMMISGHSDPTRSMAYLAIQEMQQDNTSMQWRFVSAEESGNTVYKLQNKKYTGDLYVMPIGLNMKFSRDAQNDLKKESFMMVLNPDKSWYILTRVSDNKCALSTIIKNSSHCHPYYEEGIVGGRVIAASECTNNMTREYVNQPVFTGKADQKWILEEVKK